MDIQQIHKTKKGKVSDKWESYLSVYDRILSPFRNDQVAILEIGIQNGGSLEVWSEYFKNANAIIGCDIDERCGNLKYGDSRISTIIGDIKSERVMEEIKNRSSLFDIIIDDGSHTSFDIIFTFCAYFHMLKPGGVFIVEDTHTLYMQEYGGGLFNGIGALKFFQTLTDIINYEFWGDRSKISTLIAPWFNDGDTPGFIEQGWLESIEFRNSMIIIKKSYIGSHSKLGERIIAGEDAAVNPKIKDNS